MKRTVFYISMMLAQIMMWAADNVQKPTFNIVTDTISGTLGEIVVEGKRTINKIDRQVILPTKAQRKASTNGFSLLQNLQIPSLNINVLEKSIATSFGENVQLRINGIESSIAEIIALKPSEIAKVEYIDNPGLRYGNVAAVINYVVRRSDKGGNVSGDFSNGIRPVGYGEYNLSAKYNHNRKSAFSAVASMSLRDLKWVRENSESFVYADNIISNIEIGLPTKVKYSYINTSLNYNYTNGERSTFNVALRNSYKDYPTSFSDRNSILYSDGKQYDIIDHSVSSSCIPSLDVYYQLNFKEDQHLYVDVVGTYLKSNDERIFSMTEVGTEPNDIYSKTEGDKYSVIGEAIYERRLWSGTFSSGLKHTQSHMNNTYYSYVQNCVAMNTAETYLFAEYKGNIRKMNYTLGVGAMRTYYSQNNVKQDKYIFRPTLAISGNVAKNVFLRYKVYMSGYAPSLSNLSDVEQNIDSYQIRRGNPELKSAIFVSNEFSANWNSRYVGLDLSGRYSYDDKPIMETTLREGDKFIRTYDNHCGFHRLKVLAAIKLRPWNEHINITLVPMFNRYISNGNSYKHTYSNFVFNGQFSAVYKNWVMQLSYATSYHDLWGETITKGEAMHSIAIGYNAEKWSVQAMMFNPFTKRYHQEVENISDLAPYSQTAYSNNLKQMVAINVSFNLDFGKQHRTSGKRINNSDTDTGILTGTK